jgi:uncharacterized PurR-regulated membrane protein YhhQ (DUF165 family)
VIAESVDWAVYTYLPGSIQKRMLVSNLFGIPLDSLVFVTLAFGLIWPAVIGQTVVKLASGWIVVLLVQIAGPTQKVVDTGELTSIVMVRAEYEDVKWFKQ